METIAITSDRRKLRSVICQAALGRFGDLLSCWPSWDTGWFNQLLQANDAFKSNDSQGLFGRLITLGLLFAALVLGLESLTAAEARITRRAQPFIVHDSRPRLASAIPAFATRDRAEFVQLDADVLAGSADRIREGVYRELGMIDNRGGKIHLFLRAAGEPDQEIHIAAAWYADGWQYHLLVPDYVKRTRLVRVLVQVILLEFANRGAGPKSAEIPGWLSEGISSHLMASVGPDLILEVAPVASMTKQVLTTPVGTVPVWVAPDGTQARSVLGIVGVDPLREPRQFLNQNGVLTFSELSDPSSVQMTEDNSMSFQYSSQMFFFELRRLPEGKAGVVKFLRTLPQYWNWQLAFLEVYRSRFQRLLDVEKWWSVTVMAMTGRDPTQVWSPELCFEKLDEILVSAARVRVSTNTLPIRTQVALQEVIAEWDASSQKPALERVILNLSTLRMNSPKELLSLIDGYRNCLRNYLERRFGSTSAGKGRIPLAVPTRSLARQTVRELDELFRLRESLRRAQLSANPEVVIGR